MIVEFVAVAVAYLGPVAREMEDEDVTGGRSADEPLEPLDDPRRGRSFVGQQADLPRGIEPEPALQQLAHRQHIVHAAL